MMFSPAQGDLKQIVGLRSAMSKLAQ